jgi:hypothetical protein
MAIQTPCTGSRWTNAASVLTQSSFSLHAISMGLNYDHLETPNKFGAGPTLLLALCMQLRIQAPCIQNADDSIPQLPQDSRASMPSSRA